MYTNGCNLFTLWFCIVAEANFYLILAMSLDLIAMIEDPVMRSRGDFRGEAA